MAHTTLGVRQYRILRAVLDGSPDAQRPLTQIEIHAATRLHEAETPGNTYSAIRRLRDRGLLATRKNLDGDPRSTTVHITEDGERVYDTATADLGIGTAATILLEGVSS